LESPHIEYHNTAHCNNLSIIFLCKFEGTTKENALFAKILEYQVIDLYFLIIIGWMQKIEFRLMEDFIEELTRRKKDCIYFNDQDLYLSK
jgi:hypothetical protein